MNGRILVTGAGGQLGLSIKKISGDYPDFDYVFTDVAELDITDLQAVRTLLEEQDIDVIVNCAAYTAVDRAESDMKTATLVNSYGTEVLARAAAVRGAAMVHISTDYVFDGTACRPYGEDAEPNPKSVYGITKAMGERAFAESGCRGAIVRTAWLYSEFGRNFVKTMLELARERSSVCVVCDQRGAPTYATDLARAVMTLVEKGFGSGQTVYHFTDEGQCTWNGFAEEIFRQAEMPCKVIPITTAQYGAAAPRPFYSVLSLDRIRDAGAVTPRWQDSLAECIGIIRNK